MQHLLNKIHHADCLEFMRSMPDKCVDLVLTDPPYGINFGKFNRTNKDSKGNRYKSNKYKNGDWDNNFTLDCYFNEIERISKIQIIWGGNYFPCLWRRPVKCFIFWDKNQPVDNFADGELAWTNIDKPAKRINFQYYGNIEGNTSASKKYHPTQKPVQLFKWCIQQAKLEKGTVFDPFSGSGTTALACHDLGLDFICVEKDEDYYKASVKRLEEHQRQGILL